jgi:Uma2 family endonuclease
MIAPPMSRRYDAVMSHAISLQYDRGRKAAAYARAGIPTLWIVDLGERSVEVLGEPDRDGARYRRQQRIAEDASLVLPNGRAVTASALLPPP